MRVVFTVTAEGFEPLVVELDDDQARVVPRAWPEDFNQARRCKDCVSPPEDRLCSLISGCYDVLVFFSRLISCSDVGVSYWDGRCEVRFTDSAQRAASLVLIHSMFHSRCHFFGRFRFLLRYYPCITSPEALIHLILTTGLIGSRMGHSRALPEHFTATVATFNEKVKERLACVYENIQDLPGQDAVRNAFQILQSVSYISGHHADAFINEMGKGLKAIQREDGPDR